MAVAKLITPKVATALQTASVFVNSQIAKMHRTVHATKDNEITIKLIILTSFGFTIPLRFFFEPLSFCVMNNRLFELCCFFIFLKIFQQYFGGIPRPFHLILKFHFLNQDLRKIPRTNSYRPLHQRKL